MPLRENILTQLHVFCMNSYTANKAISRLSVKCQVKDAGLSTGGEGNGNRNGEEMLWGLSAMFTSTEKTEAMMELSQYTDNWGG